MSKRLDLVHYFFCRVLCDALLQSPGQGRSQTMPLDNIHRVAASCHLRFNAPLSILCGQGRRRPWHEFFQQCQDNRIRHCGKIGYRKACADWLMARKWVKLWLLLLLLRPS